MYNVKFHFEQFKEKNPDALFLLRHGEWYSLYGEDAQKGGKALGITVSNIIGGLKYTAQFPRTALDIYLPKLVRAGFRVAIIEAE